jgi:hypothetical protein
MSGAIPLLPLYAFILWTEETVPFCTISSMEISLMFLDDMLIWLCLFYRLKSENKSHYKLNFRKFRPVVLY